VSHPPSHQLIHRVCHQANHQNPLLLDLHLVQVLVH
jgi:hypothetical protein